MAQVKHHPMKLSTGAEFSKSNWPVLIDNLRTRFDAARDSTGFIHPRV